MAPDQAKAIMQMQPAIMKKQIQALTGKLAALNRFISRYSDRLRLFFTALKGVSLEGWGPERGKALDAIKQYLASPLTLSQPIEGKELVTSATTVSVALVRSDEDGKQRSVYFVSKMLTDVETRYTNFERIALALSMAAKKLRPYFQAHIIIVLTNYPIIAIIHKSDALG